MKNYIISYQIHSNMLEEGKISLQVLIGTQILLWDVFILGKYWAILKDKCSAKPTRNIRFRNHFKEGLKQELAVICMPSSPLILQQMEAEEILLLEIKES